MRCLSLRGVILSRSVLFIDDFEMARSYGRRRLGLARSFKKGNYASQIGARPVPFRPRRPARGSVGVSGAPRRDTRPRNARSFTRTQTKRKRQFGKPVMRSENSSISSTRFGRRARVSALIYKKFVGRRIDRSSTSRSIASAQGSQVSTSFEWGSYGDLYNIRQALSGSPGAGVPPVKFFVGYLKMKFLIKNQSNIMSRLVLYDCAIRSQPYSSSTDGPKDCWMKGMSDFGLTNDPDVPYTTPLRSPEFRKFWRVVRATTINMEPGQQHEHTIYRKFNWLGQSDRIDLGAGQALMMTPFGTALLAVQCGGLVSGLRAGGTQGVTVGVSQFDYLTQYEITSALLPGTVPSYVSSAVYVNDVVAPRFMGEAGDNVMAVDDVPNGGGVS